MSNAMPGTVSPAGPSRPAPVWLLVTVQAAVSAASLVVEIVAGRMLAPWLGMSLYTWTSIIAVVLAGFSAGHWAGGLIAGKPVPRALLLTAWALAGAALSTSAAVFLLRWFATPVIEGLGHPVASIVALSMLAFFLPSFFAGIPAPVLAQVAVTADPARSGKALGAMFAAGALGAIGGTLAAGFLFISWLGSTATLAVVTALYALLAAITFALAGRSAAPGLPLPSLPLMIAGLVLPLFPAAGALALPDPCTRESDYFCIRVIDVTSDAGETANLMVLDHLAHGGAARDTPSRMMTGHAGMLAALPMARFSARDFSAFFIGGGSFTVPRGFAAAGVSSDMTVAEIDPAVTRIAIDRFWFDPSAARVLPIDARLALNSDPRRYDVIVGDAFTDIAVPAHLVTQEFFQLVRSRLTDDGIYVMNVVDHVGRLRALGAITQTLRSVFPVVEIWAETKRPEEGERITFIVLAGQSATETARITTSAPESVQFGRLSSGSVDALLLRTNPPVLTDDYAPIDRLMGRLD